MSKINYVLVALVFLVLSCAEGKKQGKSGLPFLGHHEINAEHPEDTIYHTVPSFAFENQDGKVITNEAVKGKIYVANFFFTSCPTICPKMTSQLKRLQSMTKEEGIVILSHSVDPIRDSVARLKKYAIDNGLDTKNWHLMTGDAEDIYDLGMEGYNLSAMDDGSAPGGFLHSEMVVLVDKEGHLRGMYEGTNTEAMDRLVADIKKLKTEYE
jgi:protein SCO1/2